MKEAVSSEIVSGRVEYRFSEGYSILLMLGYNTVIVTLRRLASLPMAPQNFGPQDFSRRHGHVSFPVIDDAFATIEATDEEWRTFS
jgi:hypothetical protein